MSGALSPPAGARAPGTTFDPELGAQELGLAGLTDAEVARRQARPPLLRKAKVSAYEALLTLLLLLPLPLWVVGGGPTAGFYPLLLGLALAGGSGLVFRRMPPPVPSGALLPAGLVWAAGALVLPGGIPALTTAILAGVVLVLYATAPSAGETVPPVGAILAQASIPALGGGLALLVAGSLLGTAAPLYSVVLVPTLGALALAVYLFGREGGSPDGATSSSHASSGGPAAPPLEGTSDPLGALEHPTRSTGGAGEP